MGARVISIQGRIDAATIIEFERQLAGSLHVHRIVLDLSAATGVPPRTRSLWRGALRRALYSGASLAVVGANPSVRSAIDACALERVEFHRTASTALSGWAPERGMVIASVRDRPGGPSGPPDHAGAA